jgi:hypothetical protein
VGTDDAIGEVLVSEEDLQRRVAELGAEVRGDYEGRPPLLVANQVLGGSAASRMFMDLREKQSLTYGAYSDVEEGLVPVPFRAFAAVRNEVTAQAMKAFVHHLERISSELVPAAELADAKRLLIDSFPLHIETPGEIAALVAELRTYGFPDNYWDGFRAEIQAVTAEQALAVAKKYIQPQKALIVVVGKAAAVKPYLDPYGPVKVLDTEGKVVVDDVKAQKPPVAAVPTWRPLLRPRPRRNLVWHPRPRSPRQLPRIRRHLRSYQPQARRQHPLRQRPSPSPNRGAVQCVESLAT